MYSTDQEKKDRSSKTKILMLRVCDVRGETHQPQSLSAVRDMP